MGVVSAVLVPPGGMVVVPVAGSVVVAVGSTTFTVPVIAGCAPQTNAYVPGVSKRHVPLQPTACGAPGRGGTWPASEPAVWVHAVGCRSEKLTL